MLPVYELLLLDAWMILHLLFENRIVLWRMPYVRSYFYVHCTTMFNGSIRVVRMLSHDCISVLICFHSDSQIFPSSKSDDISHLYRLSCSTLFTVQIICSVVDMISNLLKMWNCSHSLKQVSFIKTVKLLSLIKSVKLLSLIKRVKMLPSFY